MHSDTRATIGQASTIVGCRSLADAEGGFRRTCCGAPVVVRHAGHIVCPISQGDPGPRPECRPAHLADLDRATKPATHHRSVAPGYRQMLCHGEKNSGGGWHFTSRTS